MSRLKMYAQQRHRKVLCCAPVSQREKGERVEYARMTEAFLRNIPAPERGGDVIFVSRKLCEAQAGFFPLGLHSGSPAMGTSAMI
jgi:hypothetical protein